MLEFLVVLADGAFTDGIPRGDVAGHQEVVELSHKHRVFHLSQKGVKVLGVIGVFTQALKDNKASVIEFNLDRGVVIREEDIPAGMVDVKRLDVFLILGDFWGCDERLDAVIGQERLLTITFVNGDEDFVEVGRECAKQVIEVGGFLVVVRPQDGLGELGEEDILSDTRDALEDNGHPGYLTGALYHMSQPVQHILNTRTVATSESVQMSSNGGGKGSARAGFVGNRKGSKCVVDTLGAQERGRVKVHS